MLDNRNMHDSVGEMFMNKYASCYHNTHLSATAKTEAVVFIYWILLWILNRTELCYQFTPLYENAFFYLLLSNTVEFWILYHVTGQEKAIFSNMVGTKKAQAGFLFWVFFPVKNGENYKILPFWRNNGVTDGARCTKAEDIIQRSQ